MGGENSTIEPSVLTSTKISRKEEHVHKKQKKNRCPKSREASEQSIKHKTNQSAGNIPFIL